MKTLTICVATIVSVLATGGITMIRASDVSGPLPIVFSAATIGLDGKSRNEFAVKEPIWVRFSLENVSDGKVTLWGFADRADGVVITVEGDSSRRARALSRGIVIDQCYSPMVFQPRERITFDILLADWVDIAGEGTVDLQATYDAGFPVGKFPVGKGSEEFTTRLRAMGVDERPLRRKTNFSVTLKGQIEGKGLEALLKDLQTLYASDSSVVSTADRLKAIQSRLKAIQSVRAIRVVETLPLLAKAVEDKVEEVQFEAVRSLSVLPYPDVTPILKKAADSRYELVKLAAQVELDRREKANPGSF